jgi:hypothetical protein
VLFVVDLVGKLVDGLSGVVMAALVLQEVDDGVFVEFDDSPFLRTRTADPDDRAPPI